MTNTKKILFIKLSNSTFILKDEEILNQHFEVTSYFYGTEKGFKAGLSLVKQFFYLLLNIWKYDLIYIWFADYHSFLPALFSWLFKKKTIIVLGGFDVMKIPELNYGGHISRIRSWFIKASCYLSDKLLVVSEYAQIQASRNISPKVISKTEIIYNGIDTVSFKNLKKERQNKIIYVSAAEDERRAKIKGIDKLLKVAEKLPNYEFLLVGVADDFLNQTFNSHPENIKTISFISKNKLITLYNEHKVVLQLSVIESFGVSVVEAMACGCVPVVSAVGGLKEVVKSDYGYLVDRNHTDNIRDSVLDAFKTYDKKSDLAQQKVLADFSDEDRKKAILNAIN